jgi:hypoxanthine phosphoribosyltransferase
VKALSGIKADIKDRHVVIVEDIVETGITITAVIEELKKLGPASVRLASAFLKKGSEISVILGK